MWCEYGDVGSVVFRMGCNIVQEVEAGREIVV